MAVSKIKSEAIDEAVTAFGIHLIKEVAKEALHKKRFVVLATPAEKQGFDIELKPEGLVVLEVNEDSCKLFDTERCQRVCELSFNNVFEAAGTIFYRLAASSEEFTELEALFVKKLSEIQLQ